MIKSAAVLAAFLLTAFCHGQAMTGVRELPEAFYAESDAALRERISGTFTAPGVSVTAESSADETLSSTVSCRLLGVITVKKVPAYIGSRAELVPGGRAVGISIYTDGVLVVGTGSFVSESGRKLSPASDAGVKAGDVILSVNGTGISNSRELQALLDSPERAVLDIERSGERITLTVTPSRAETGEYRIGAWVRDSTVGIGTLSFYDRVTGLAAALGHAVVDADTGSLLKVKDGKLVAASVLGVTKGRSGAPGELHGTFDDGSFCIGSISANTELGIYGYLADGAKAFLAGEPVPVAFPDEAETGSAQIITPACGEPEIYSCRIIKTGRQNEPAPKGLVIEITDERLVSVTGGIVQGMSGSPILQNGRLVGVVTHVFVNDPLKGYGAYAYWMYKRFGG